MHSHLRPLLFLAALALPLAPGAFAQGAPEPEEDGPGVRFNGYGRSLIQQTGIGGTITDTDTLSVESLSDGEFLLDLAVNAQPNDVTEVQGVIRVRNEFGGFFGSGVTVEVRELWARGIIADVLRYRVGDMDLALTPYTLYLPEADGVINTPALFRPLREVIYHDEFYTGFNERRFQGGRLDFGLAFEQGIEAAEVRAFLARLRSTDFLDVPTRFIGGGRVGATFGPYDSQAKLGANLAYIWDDLDSGEANTGIRNAVVSLDGDLTVLDGDALDLHVVGEGGWSSVERAMETDEAEEEPPAEEDPAFAEDTDTFIEIGLASTFEGPQVGVSALFVNVGPEFYSAAAQSKRIDYTRAKSFYNRIGTDRDLRGVTLFDLTRDEALYTFRIADELMAYDPRYGNVLPYGRATPNRRGVRFGVAYAPTDGALGDVVDAALDLAVLREIRGQGTDELKDFVLLRGEADLHVGEYLGWDRALTFTLGSQYESTSRDGEPVEEVDLTSLLFEAGVAAEVYDRLDLLVGVKFRSSDGRDYLPVIENFNDVADFSAPFVTDDQEALFGTGLRYRFSDEIYLTVQFQRFSYSDDATPADDYTLNQVFALYTMTF
jgi:hypothetical protein